MDPLLNAFKRLLVLVSNVDEREFKLSALDALRLSDVYKRLKLKPTTIQSIERNLVQEHLSPVAFYVLCALYTIEIVVVNKWFHYNCGINPQYAIRGTMVGRIGNLSTFEYCPVKPLYAVSHYTLGELREIAVKFNLRNTGTKTIIYTSITETIKKIELSEL